MPTILGFAALFLLATDALQLGSQSTAGTVGEEPDHLSASRCSWRCAWSSGAARSSADGPDAGRVHRADRLCHRHLAGRRRWSSSTRTMTSIASGIQLKSGLIDYYIFFLVFLFGVQTTEDAMKVIKGLLLGALLRQPRHDSRRRSASSASASAFAIDGRTAGAIGESNQYAAFIILFLPATVAAAVAARGFRRLFWFGGALVGCDDARHDRVARRLRGHSRWPARSAPIYTVISSPTAASPAGCSGRSSCWCSCVTLLAIRQPAGGTHVRHGQHRREHGVVGTQRHLGDRARRRCSRIRSPSSPASAGTCTGRCRSSSRRTITISRLWFNLGLVGLVCGSYLLFSGDRPRAPRQPAGGAAAARPAHRVRARRRRRGHRRVLRRPARALVSTSGCTRAS